MVLGVVSRDGIEFLATVPGAFIADQTIYLVISVKVSSALTGDAWMNVIVVDAKSFSTFTIAGDADTLVGTRECELSILGLFNVRFLADEI